MRARSSLENVIIAGRLNVDISKIKIIDNSALLNFEAIKHDNALNLHAIQAKFISDAILSTNKKAKSHNAAIDLDTLNDGGHDEEDEKTYLRS